MTEKVSFFSLLNVLTWASMYDHIMAFLFDIKLRSPLLEANKTQSECTDTLFLLWAPLTFLIQCFCCCLSLSFLFLLSHHPSPRTSSFHHTHHEQSFKRQDQNNLHHIGNYRRWPMSHIVTARCIRRTECIKVGLVSDCLQQGTRGRFSDMKQPITVWKALQLFCAVVWPWSTCCARHS